MGVCVASQNTRRKSRFGRNAATYFSPFRRSGDGSFQSSVARDYQKPEAAGNTKSVIVSLLMMDDVADHLAREQNKLPVILNQFSGSPEPSRTYAEFWQERKDVGVVS